MPELRDLQPLADLLARRPGQVPASGTTVLVDGREQRLQAVLDRVVVLAPMPPHGGRKRWTRRHMVDVEQVYADPGELRWRRR